jgi:hypothetical protein
LQPEAPDTPIRCGRRASRRRGQDPTSPPPRPRALSLRSPAPTTHSLPRSSPVAAMEPAAEVGGGLQGWALLPTAYELATTIGQGCCSAKGVATRAVGLATWAHRSCNKGWPELLQRAACIASMAWRRCYHQPCYKGIRTCYKAPPELLQRLARVAPKGGLCCYHGVAALRPPASGVCYQGAAMEHRHCCISDGRG